MALPQPIPDALRTEPFLLAKARDAGLSRDVLRGARFRRLHPGVYVCAGVAMTLQVRVAAALLALPDDAVASHVTAVQLLGVNIGPDSPLHFSTRHPHQVRLAGIACHRLTDRLSPVWLAGAPLMPPEQAWVRSAAQLGFVDRVVAGDWLLHLGRTQLTSLQKYATASHEPGVQRARRALAHVRGRVESPRETRLRLMLVFARLPEPQPNLSVGDSEDFIARPDLVYQAYRVLVEYDGDHHRTDRRQWRRDIVRREALEREGWRIIVVTAECMRDPHNVVRRVHRALVERGYRGPEPVFSDVWCRWFAT